MNAIELPRALAEAAELAEIVHVLVQDHDSMVVEAVRDQDPAIRQERDVLRLAEMGLVRPLHALLAERLQQLAAVVREDIDLAERLVDHPDASFLVVRADANAVGPWTV